jgi:putative tricarboxylic transport membrane protein
LGDLLSNLSTGFDQALTLQNLGYAFVGVLIGTVVGVLPGIGAITAIALLIPFSFGLDPISGLILLSGVYYGSMYGSSTTAILVRTPGDVASIVTTLDGYEMAKRGRARQALATAAIGSFIAGTFSTIGLMTLAPALASVAIYFGSAEYFLLMVLALSMVSSLSTGSALKALIATLFGLAIGTVGTDPQTSVARFTFGTPNLLDGLDFALVAIALFALSEAFSNLAAKRRGESAAEPQQLRGSLWMTREDWRRSAGPYARGSVSGFLIGVMPGIGPALASFVSYAMERRLSKHPEEFGKGAIEGVSGPETANNAGTGGAMVPLFTLGIPGSATTALLLSVFIMYGLQPGPQMWETNPTLLWAIIASMYIGNVMLLVLNLPLVGVWAALLKIPAIPLYTGVVTLSVLGAYSLTYTQFSLFLLLGFGIVGYLMQRYDFPLAPAVLGLVLGALMEQRFREAMLVADGSLATFVERPLSLTILIVIFLVAVLPRLVLAFRNRTRRGSQ